MNSKSERVNTNKASLHVVTPELKKEGVFEVVEY